MLPALPLPAVPRRLVAVLSTLALVVGGLVAGIAPAKAASANLVVSQVYGGGGNSNATYTHDFVEIFNRGSSEASLNGMSIQYASAAGTGAFGGNTGQLTELPSVTVQPGQYVLVQEASNAAVGAALPTPDVTDITPIAMAAGAGKVALVTGTTSLGCNGGSLPCDATASARIVDLVGYGTGASGANFFEGSAAAPTLSSTLADQRKNNGCQDTDDNAADFATATPAARNTSTTLAPCGTPPGDNAPSVTATSPTNGATDVAVSVSPTVTFSEPVSAAGAFSLTCGTSGNHELAVTGGPTNFTLDPTNDFVYSETCTVAVAAANVTDSDAQDPPDSMTVDYAFSFTTVPPPPACTDPQTHVISQVQGSGLTSPLVNTVVTVEGVVTAVRPGLSGFFMEEETGDRDVSTDTSEGVFVRATAPTGTVPGDVVQVTGGVREFTGSANGVPSSQTQISDRVIVLACGLAALPAPATVEFPLDAVSDLERVEGMRATFPQDLVISEYFNYGRFNETVVGLPPGGRDRFDTPTAVQEPSVTDTQALLADYARRRITVDDGRSAQNPSPPYFPGSVDSPFTLDNGFRGGDTLTDITGVVEHTFGLYRVHPTTDAAYSQRNPRPQATPSVGNGDVKVASFNVLNYFLTEDGIPTDDNNNNPADDICGGEQNLDCRGYDNGEPLELGRQRAKIVDAISRLDADVVGLMEMENTPGVEPAADLVAGLNAATAPGTYDYIDTGVIGTDAIRLGFLYRPGTVTPVGDFEVLDSTDDPRFDDSRSRPALAQTFQQNGTPDRFTVAVNHLKSKGSACAGDPDLGDGAGNCNVTRTEAAQALVDWLSTDPTGSGDTDRLIIGDLNSYDHEDPIDAIADAGYTDLLKQFGGEYSYSYVFDGQVGYLDHALASDSLLPQVTGAADWHINADEPSILDYDTSFKNPPEESLYEPNAFRSSDHDPVLVAMDLGRCQFSDDPDTQVLTLLGDCTTRSTVGIPDGWTLDGDGHTITAVDVPGTAFVGAVVANEGDAASVRDLTVTTYDLADVCHDGADQQDRLRGILLDGASGTISGNHVLDINQGASGCQEGNAIEARNAPFSTAGPDVTVTIADNVVDDYQKTGILVNGSVRATVTGNEVSGLGPVPYIAQNGVQVSRGATATVESNRLADNWYTGSADAISCGLLLFEADGVKQKRNVFVANQQDLCNFGRGGGSPSR